MTTNEEAARAAAEEWFEKYEPALLPDPVESLTKLILSHLSASVAEQPTEPLRAWCEDCGSKKVVVVRKFDTAEQFIDAYNRQAESDLTPQSPRVCHDNEELLPCGHPICMRTKDGIHYCGTYTSGLKVESSVADGGVCSSSNRSPSQATASNESVNA